MPTTWSIEMRPTPRARGAVRRDGDVPGQVRAGVLRAIHERVDVVAVGRDRGELDSPLVVLHPVRLDDTACAALDGLAIGVGRIGDGERDVAHAVSLRRRPLADLAVRAQTAREDEADIALLEDVGGAVAHARLGPCIRGAGEAVRRLVEERGLLRVPDPDLEVVPTVDRHEIVFAHTPDLTPPAREQAGGGRERSRSR